LLPKNSTSVVNEETLKNATREQLLKLTEELANVVVEHQKVRETSLDINKLKWPTIIEIVVNRENSSPKAVITKQIPALIDTVGRLFIRYDEVKESWFRPGFILERKAHKGVDKKITITEVILESDIFYVGEKPVCIQLTVRQENEPALK